MSSASVLSQNQCLVALLCTTMEIFIISMVLASRNQVSIVVDANLLSVDGEEVSLVFGLTLVIEYFGTR
jgi:hypothetical protein